MAQPCDQHLDFFYVERVVRRVIPEAEDSVTVSATNSIQECVTRFLAHFTKEASKLCAEEQRNEITGDDILWAMYRSGFQKYAKPLRTYLAKYRMSRADPQLGAISRQLPELESNASALTRGISAEVIELDDEPRDLPLGLLPSVDQSGSHTAAIERQGAQLLDRMDSTYLMVNAPTLEPQSNVPALVASASAEEIELDEETLEAPPKLLPEVDLSETRTPELLSDQDVQPIKLAKPTYSVVTNTITPLRLKFKSVVNCATSMEVTKPAPIELGGQGLPPIDKAKQLTYSVTSDNISPFKLKLKSVIDDSTQESKNSIERKARSKIAHLNQRLYVQAQQGRVRLACPFCDYAAGYMCRLHGHIKRRHSDRGFDVCPKCEYRFTSRNHFFDWRHVSRCITKRNAASSNDIASSSARIVWGPITKSGKTAATTESLAKKKKLALDAEIAQSERKKRISFDCPICGKTMRREKSLEFHIQAVHEHTRLACPFCDFGTAYMGNLQNHIRTRHTDRSFDQCSKCLDRFTLRSHFLGKQHLSKCFTKSKAPSNKETGSVASGVAWIPLSNYGQASPDTTPYSIANKKLTTTTSEATTTKSEHRTHFDCPICGKALGSEKSLKAHIHALHDGILYACPFCDFQTGYLHLLQNHAQKNHRERTFDKCSKCMRLFAGRIHFFRNQHASTCMTNRSSISTQREERNTRNSGEVSRGSFIVA